MIELNEHENEVYHQINQLRNNPSALVDNFTLVSKALSRIPKKKKESKELLEVANSLSNLESIDELKLSPSLCMASKDILNHLKKGSERALHIKLEEEDLKEHVRNYAKKFNKVFQIIDIGSIENMLARSMISENDVKRTYKKALTLINNFETANFLENKCIIYQFPSSLPTYS